MRICDGRGDGVAVTMAMMAGTCGGEIITGG
jgi:hypothetical protein